MIIENTEIGIFFKLEKRDFKGDWKSFIAAIKKFPNRQYNPQEKPPDENWWWIGKDSEKSFYELREKLIEDIIADEEQYKKDGYKPIPSRNKFSRGSLKY